MQWRNTRNYLTNKPSENNWLSYKARLHPKVSKGELQLFRALSLAGLTGGMVTQKPIVLKATIPDFCWPQKRKIIYLDGLQAHAGDEQQKRDEEIQELLEAQGWDVLRIPYEPPLTDANLHEIMKTIKQFLNVDEE
jgi:very-short-patch-repair endonuclease